MRRAFDASISSRRFLHYQAGALDRCRPAKGDIAAFDGHDYVLLKRHYYLPLPDPKDLQSIRETELIGCDIDAAVCFSFHAQHVAAFDPEFREFPQSVAGSQSGYHVANGTFMAVDGNMYYGLIRAMAPARIVEIGSGNSTKLACAAIRKNVAEGRRTSELVCVEPFHASVLEELAEISEIRREYVQDVDMGVFTGLGAGDILFIDSTHTVRPGGDVWWEICEILPRLKPGVLVHFHDISLPRPYPARTLENHWYWMEQYLLQAFLTFNRKFKVVWAGNYLMLKDPERMTELFGGEYAVMRSAYPDSEPASLWLQVMD